MLSRVLTNLWFDRKLVGAGLKVTKPLTHGSCGLVPCGRIRSDRSRKSCPSRLQVVAQPLELQRPSGLHRAVRAQLHPSQLVERQSHLQAEAYFRQ